MYIITFIIWNNIVLTRVISLEVIIGLQKEIQTQIYHYAQTTDIHILF